MKVNALIFLFSCVSLISLAQEKIEVTIEEKEMSQGVNTAFVTFVPESDLKEVENDWKKYANKRSILENITKGAAGRLVGNTYKSIATAVSPDTELEKNHNKLRMERENNELVVRNIIHKHVTQDMLDIYARLLPIDGGTQLNTFFQYSDSVFINETNVDEETLLSIKNYVYEFGVEAYQNVVSQQIKDAERELRRMNVVLDNLVSKNESLHKDIARMEADIDKCESDIKLNNKQVERVADSYNDVKKEMLDYEKKSVQYESLKELAKERKNEKKKIMNQNKRLKTRIKKLQVRIKNTMADIIDNEQEQRGQEALIASQEEVVKKLEEKYQNIE
ncbi:MAG: hypothetical protein JXR31_03535 [Prolixibacteraceae bacterium]|nr:hypothetical protein [Prolixibacteraceae bacterium]